MFSYCLNCRNNSKSKTRKIVKENKENLNKEKLLK